MKNQSFAKRLGYACEGFVAAWRAETNFRIHVLAAVIVLCVLVWRRPQPIWWAAIAITVVLVIAAELFNTAIEHLADHVHPDRHPQIKVVKDCAAAAVLAASIGALAVAAAFVFDQFYL